jgi:hypothetical protein
MKLVKGFDELVLILLTTDNNTKKKKKEFVISFKGQVGGKQTTL